MARQRLLAERAAAMTVGGGGSGSAERARVGCFVRCNRVPYAPLWSASSGASGAVAGGPS